MQSRLPDLPYPLDALEPFISARTLSIHHGKHHRAYVDRTNALIGENPASLEEIIARAAGKPGEEGAVQQRGAGLEPCVLLALPAAKRRASAA